MSGRTCVERTGGSTLRYRTAALAARDTRLFPHQVGRVLLGLTRGEPSPEAAVSHDALLSALTGDDAHRRTGAAFVAGRCTTGDAGDDAETLAALRELIGSLDPSHLRSDAETYVEAVMSSALLGDVDGGRRLLNDLVTIPANDSIAGSLAAYYLAQLGDPAGYTVMQTDLHDRDDAHARLMATRRLLAFVAHDGARVGDRTIDVRRDFLDRLGDRDDDVVGETPELMLETGVPELVTAVREATERPHSKATRKAAKAALDGYDAAR